MNTSKCECGFKRIFACVMSVALACIIGVSFTKTNVAFATTETLDLQGSMTFSLEYQEDPAPIVPDDIAGSDNATQDALRASEISRSSLLARTSDVLLYAVLALLVGSLVFAFVSIKSTRKVPAHARDNASINVYSHKTKVIIVAMLGISLVLGTTSVGIRAFAEDEEVPSPVTLSSNVVVNQHGKILSNSLILDNKLTGDVTIEELNAPDELSGWAADIDADQVIPAGETLDKSWTPDADAIPASLLEKINAGEEVKLTFSVKASYNKFTVIWDGNFAGSMNATTQYVENEIATVPSAPERENYDFVAWNTEMDGSGDEVTSEYLQDNPITEDTTFYAVWSPKTFNITYELNGGKLADGEENPTTYVYLTGVDSFKSPNKVGHTFNGWSTDVAGANKVTSIDNARAGDVTLYANWTANTYNITYNLDGGTLPSGQTNPSTYTYGIGVTSFAPLEKTGHDFVGWFDAATAGNQVTSITTTDIEAKILYARFVPKEYTIEYKLAGGEWPDHVSDPVAKYTYGVGVAEGFESPIRVGYTFDGWFSEETAGTEITEITTTDFGDKTLWAHWTANTYNITYNLDGGTLPSGQTNPATYTYGVGVTSFAPLEKTGHDFVGWFDAATDGNQVTSITTTDIEAKTLYARFTPKVFNITYELDGGEGNMNPATYTYGIGVQSFTAVTKVGYTFAGWYSAASGGSAITSISTTSLDDKTLYAHWTPNTNTPYNVEHYKQNVADDNYPDTPADTDNLTGTTATDTNAQAKAKSGDYANFTLSGTVTQEKIAADGTSVIKLYYTRDKFNVAFNLNGKTGTTPDAQSVKFEGHAEMPANPTTTGYVFDGWFTSQDASGDEFDFASNQVTDAITLYAKWTPIQYTVSFNKNDADATGTMESITCTYDQEFTLPECTYTKQSAVLSGWATSSTGDVVYINKAKITENLANTENATVELFAKWQNGYTVTYDPKGVSGADVTGYWIIDGVRSNDVITETVMPGDTIKGPKDASGNAIDPTPNDDNNEGYIFDGWYDANGDPVNIGDSITENIEVFANYSNNTFLAPANQSISNPRNITGTKYGVSRVKAAAESIKNGTNPNSTVYNATNDSYHLYSLMKDLDGKFLNADSQDNWAEFRIIGVGDHDGDGSGLTFQMVHGLPTRYAYDSKETYGSSLNWNNSTLRPLLQPGGNVYNQFDTQFTRLIKSVAKKYNTTAGISPTSSTTSTTTDAFSILSYTEYQKSVDRYYWSDVQFGSTYAFWNQFSIPDDKSSNITQLQNLCKTRSGTLLIDGSENKGYSWQRTVSLGYSYYSLVLNSDGRLHSYTGDNRGILHGVALSFAL